MKKKKIIIKKSNLRRLRYFLEEKNITLKNILSIQRVYCESIYLGKTSNTFLSWKTDDLSSERIELLVKMINSLLENAELIYGGDE